MMTEGNPRWFIGVVSELFQDLEPPQLHSIPKNEQARAVESAAIRFMSRLRTIVVPPTMPRLDVLIGRIGTSLENQVLGREFVPEPKLSVHIEKTIRREEAAIIERAVGAGALVPLDKSDADALRSPVRGRRFRLCYLLAPLYRLPLRSGKSLPYRQVAGEASRDLIDLLETDDEG